MKSSKIAQTFDGYSKQDTADKLILSYFAATHGFLTPDTPWLDFHFFSHSVKRQAFQCPMHLHHGKGIAVAIRRGARNGASYAKRYIKATLSSKVSS
jgi:hypothetical protein